MAPCADGAVPRFIPTFAELAAVVHDHRLERRIDRQRLADLADVPLDLIDDIESGTPRPELDAVLTVLDILGIRVSALPSPKIKLLHEETPPW